MQTHVVQAASELKGFDIKPLHAEVRGEFGVAASSEPKEFLTLITPQLPWHRTRRRLLPHQGAVYGYFKALLPH